MSKAAENSRVFAVGIPAEIFYYNIIMLEYTNSQGKSQL